MKSILDDFVLSQEDAQRLIDAAGPAQQHAAHGGFYAAELQAALSAYGVQAAAYGVQAAEIQAALGLYTAELQDAHGDAAEAFDLDAFELKAIVDVKEAKHATDR